jgi:hypothetical protein
MVPLRTSGQFVRPALAFGRFGDEFAGCGRMNAGSGRSKMPSLRGIARPRHDRAVRDGIAGGRSDFRFCGGGATRLLGQTDSEARED